MNLAELLQVEPGKTTDFRRDLSPKAEFLRTIVAFANSSGGTVVLGVDPGDRSVRGIADPLALEERIDKMVADGVRPAPGLDQEILPWRQSHLVAVRVHPGPQRPYHLRKGGLASGVYVRSGAQDRLADPEMVEDLKRRSLGRAYDEEACADASPEDLDAEALERSCRRAGQPVPRSDDLRALRLLVEHEGRLVPTRGGLLLFGRRRLDAFPDAWVQAGRFAGQDVDCFAFLEALSVRCIAAAYDNQKKRHQHQAFNGSRYLSHHEHLQPQELIEAGEGPESDICHRRTPRFGVVRRWNGNLPANLPGFRPVRDRPSVGISILHGGVPPFGAVCWGL